MHFSYHVPMMVDQEEAVTAHRTVVVGLDSMERIAQHGKVLLYCSRIY